ncbi:two-component system, sporulation sensor kinase B [Paenibacillus sp. GP183]|nr:two-component system, sporulation sensor kinase B [Paenibacillus sp. GP183]
MLMDKWARTLKAFDDLLLNILVLTLPILIYSKLRMDKPYQEPSIFNPKWVFAYCSPLAVFCISHPLFSAGEISYDLSLIPLLAAFLYGGIGSGLIVSAVEIVFSYYFHGPEVEWVALITVFLIPFILSFIYLSNWKHKSPKIMFPALLALICAFATFCVSLFDSFTNEIPFTLSSILIGLGYCVIHMLTMSMITFLIEHIKENLALRQEFQKSEKLNVLSELAASVAHEIRNPMTVARGFMQILNQSQVSEEKKRMYTAMVIEEIDRAQNIISDYLSLAKPQAEKLEKLDASTLSQKLANLINPYASLLNVQIAFEMESYLWILANGEKLMQCLVNLTKNGIEAMPDGGTLQIRGYKEKDLVRIEIRDNGIGMTHEQLERLGTPFYSTKQKGTGLGMMVSYRIIKTFGGTIDVTSQLNKGTCFVVTLPGAS